MWYGCASLKLCLGCVHAPPFRVCVSKGRSTAGGQAAMGDSDKVKVSLRSVGGEDTTEVSAPLGGGGHCAASSFITTITEFAKWTV